MRTLDILAACGETLEVFELEDPGPVFMHDDDWGPHVSHEIELPDPCTLTVACVLPNTLHLYEAYTHGTSLSIIYWMYRSTS